VKREIKRRSRKRLEWWSGAYTAMDGAVIRKDNQ
jgi:hypothetical protein